MRRMTQGVALLEPIIADSKRGRRSSKGAPTRL